MKCNSVVHVPDLVLIDTTMNTSRYDRILDDYMMLLIDES